MINPNIGEIVKCKPTKPNVCILEAVVTIVHSKGLDTLSVVWWLAGPWISSVVDLSTFVQIYHYHY